MAKERKSRRQERRQVLKRDEVKRIFRGLLVWTSSNEGHKSISLVDFDSYHAERLTALLDFISYREVTIAYYVSDALLSAEQLQEEHMKSVFGSLRTDFNVVRTELTGYLWTNEELTVGGHDIMRELESFAGKYLHIEITYYNERWVTVDE